jgi:hypothetical protein
MGERGAVETLIPPHRPSKINLHFRILSPSDANRRMTSEKLSPGPRR